MSTVITLFPEVAEKHYFQNAETKEYWFHATAVCKRLGYSNVTSALMLHTDEDERLREVFHGRDTWFVSESGVYGLAMGAKTEEAKEFKRWLKHEVLPKLRAQELYTLRSRDESLEEYQSRESALIKENNRLKAEKAQSFTEGKQAAANLLPQPERVTNPERHIYKVSVACLLIMGLNYKAMDAFEIGQRMRQEALDGAWIMHPEYRDTLIQSPDPATIDFALQCLQQVGLVDFTGRHAKLKATKAKAATIMGELLRESGKLYKPLTEHIACWQESIEHWHQ
jgi:prophage antirepressor-like protein